ncbi:hypothetical protein OQA88_11063 [Cercophora sp. LCS_1]
MPKPQPPPPQPITFPLDQAHNLLASFTSFLTVAIHNTLFYREIYPQPTFLSTRAYGLPVHQNRHPKVCAWIRDAVTSIASQLTTGSVSHIAIVIHSPQPQLQQDPEPPSRFSSSSASPSAPPPGTVLERWVIDVSRFPTWPTGEKGSEKHTKILSKDFRDEEAREKQLKVNWTDVDEQFRGALRRMAYAAEAMEALPRGCTFTVALELREEGLAPIGSEQIWIPAEGEGSGGPEKTMPIRNVQAGPLAFECWVEEGSKEG